MAAVDVTCGKKTNKKLDTSKEIPKGRNKKKKKPSEEEVIRTLQEAYGTIDTSKVDTFQDFPLSQNTLKGLKENSYTKPTDIQVQSIGLSLRGFDILGAAKTGSGKTLAFLIPVLETLFCKRWSRLDGVGALIITPTRELAYQIFETLRKVGVHHDISGGLIIGGKDLHFEKKRMDQCNVVICTPGRLLQHMDENPLFDCSNMQILVLDEADRCLDMGFEKTMNNIIENLPPEKQTLLFSATQTKSVRDLARLSLKDPMYVSVHEHAKHSTPEGLRQNYIVCELHEKINMLWSFIRNHLKKKILVFMTSCKQVKYHYEIFCKLRPGTTLLSLYGSLHQLRRMEIYEAFTRKSNAVLFATDIAARGLDFPAVDWVVQLDCPEDANTYIHRAGRTARYEKGGESLLVLTPSEEPGMVEQLRTKRIPISKIKINPKMLQTQAKKIEAFLAKDSNLKQSAQRALVTYAKSIFLMKNKAVFDVNSLDTDSYSKSLGLAVPPRIRFIQKSQKNREQQKAKLAANNAHDPVKALRTSKVQISESKESDNDSESGNDSIMGSKETNIPNQEFNKDSSQNRSGWDGEGDSDSDDILQLKRRNHELEGESLLPEEDIPLRKSKNKKHVTKAAIAKKILKKKIVANKKIVFDEEGEVIANQTKDKISTLAKEYEQENLGGIDIDKAKLVLREEDKFDKQLFRDKAKAKRKETKRKEKKIKDDEAEVELEGTSSDEGSGPDLSWLPDPDKVYSSGKRSIKSKWSNIESDGSEQNISGGSDSREEGESDDSSDEEIEEIHRPLPLKRKLSRKNIRDKKRKQGSDDDQPMDTGLSLLEDEELALQFLKTK